MRIERITEPETIAPHIEPMVSVYGAAFAQPPYNETAQAAQSLRAQLQRHATYPGFAACLAWEGERLLGFVYGTTNLPGQWWYERVAPALTADQRVALFDGAFVVVELAVHPDTQGRGVGGQLLNALLTAVPHTQVVLSARTDASAALSFYGRRGWQPLVENFRFPDGNLTYDILARRRSE
jgi:ribosomal protein S18 acetylase RimI-like enzyme